MAHTKGPWTIRKVKDSDGDTWDNIETETHTICLMTGGTGNDEGNSSLVSTAPDLLEVCENINGKINQEFLDYGGPHASFHVMLSYQEIEALRAAIAKAKAEAPNE